MSNDKILEPKWFEFTVMDRILTEREAIRSHKNFGMAVTVMYALHEKKMTSKVHEKYSCVGELEKDMMQRITTLMEVSDPKNPASNFSTSRVAREITLGVYEIASKQKQLGNDIYKTEDN